MNRQEDAVMKKIRPLVPAVLGVVLLPGSFPVRAIAGTMLCDAMRIAGFLLLGAVAVLRFR